MRKRTPPALPTEPRGSRGTPPALPRTASAPLPAAFSRAGGVAYDQPHERSVSTRGLLLQQPLAPLADGIATAPPISRTTSLLLRGGSPRPLLGGVTPTPLRPTLYSPAVSAVQTPGPLGGSPLRPYPGTLHADGTQTLLHQQQQRVVGEVPHP